MQSSIKNRQFLAPAKLNIRLKVTGVRPDGYHELVSIMVPVGLFDRLDLALTRPNGITLSCKGFSVPDDKENLVFRAASQFFSQTDLNHGISIKLTKNIPVSAGLGGGSSDAACVLMALNEMCANPLSSKDLAEIAVGLGADVPFFLHGRPCLAEGIGEILNPIENWPKFWYLIITPDFKVSTSWVYRNLKLKLTSGEYLFIVRCLEEKSVKLCDILENDLESVTASHFPIIYHIKRSLMESGAEGALMSGSGPSVFGIFASENQALKAKKALICQDFGNIYVVEGLS
jgi:4-diphosphocytidyl-2-C-methyl-D-erythritol kinase